MTAGSTARGSGTQTTVLLKTKKRGQNRRLLPKVPKGLTGGDKTAGRPPGQQGEKGEGEASWPRTWLRWQWDDSGARTQVCGEDHGPQRIYTLIFQGLHLAANGRTPDP